MSCSMISATIIIICVEAALPQIGLSLNTSVFADAGMSAEPGE